MMDIDVEGAAALKPLRARAGGSVLAARSDFREPGMLGTRINDRTGTPALDAIAEGTVSESVGDGMAGLWGSRSLPRSDGVVSTAGCGSGFTAVPKTESLDKSADNPWENASASRAGAFDPPNALACPKPAGAFPKP